MRFFPRASSFDSSRAPVSSEDVTCRGLTPISDEVAHVRVDRDRLAGDALARIAAQEKRHVGDVLRADGGVQAGRLEEFLAEFLVADAVGLGFGGDDALDALALDDAGKNTVHAHLVRS